MLANVNANVKMIKKWEIAEHVTIKFDGFDLSLHKIPVFNVVFGVYWC